MNTNSETPATSSQSVDRHAERRATRSDNGGAWIIGVVLIALGVVFILQNAGALALQNWWALFILIPALGSFGAAYGAYRTNGGHLNSRVRGSIIGGLVFTALAAVFLFNLNLNLLLPAILILAGAGLLVNSILHD